MVLKMEAGISPVFSRLGGFCLFTFCFEFVIIVLMMGNTARQTFKMKLRSHSRKLLSLSLLRQIIFEFYFFYFLYSSNVFYILIQFRFSSVLSWNFVILFCFNSKCHQSDLSNKQSDSAIPLLCIIRGSPLPFCLYYVSLAS